MKLPRKRVWSVLVCVLCAAALALPAWAAELADAVDAAEVADAVEVIDAVETVETLEEADASLFGALPDNDELFYGYLLQRAGVDNRVSLSADARSTLSEKDKELYDHLKPFIEKVASGEVTNTVYTVTYPDFKLSYTAEELGVSPLVENGAFTEECKAAVYAKYDEIYAYNLHNVLSALLLDCPYELFWFDKATSGAISSGYSQGFGGNSNQVTLNPPAYVVTMKVSQDYQGGNDTTVNALPAKVSKAVATAKKIVSDNAAKGDYNKLLAYSTAICDLVSYNHDAADNKSTPYGDPWQLIDVFDGDDTTKVVCEGYSKAFKYLCDLSTFKSDNVECYLVSGTLTGGTGAGAHMWNIVTMDNGKNYLVDVTNSDSNGGPSYLFLKGGEPHSQNTAQYTFYNNNFTFVYDSDTIAQWGNELLTLDTADYTPSTEPDPEPAPVTVKGCSLTLVDDIALNFYLTLDESVTANGGAYVKLTGTRPEDEQTLPVSEAYKDSEGAYRFTARLSAKRMNDKITLTCYNGENEAYDISAAGETVKSYSYSVQDYLTLAAQKSELADVAAAMSAYGYYAQQYFQYDTENVVEPSVSLSGVTAADLSDSKSEDSGSVSGLTSVGDTLSLNSAITHSYIFQLDGKLSDYAFTVDGATVTPQAYSNDSVTGYCLQIPSIVAKGLDARHTFTVTKDGATFTHECSALSYAYKALNGGTTDTNLQDLVKAMYLYHTAAKAYFASQNA